MKNGVPARSPDSFICCCSLIDAAPAAVPDSEVALVGQRIVPAGSSAVT